MVRQQSERPQLGLYPSRKMGKYRLKKQLGKGGYCEVWMASDTIEGIDVALKIPLPDSDGKRDDKSLLKEIKLVAQLRHPNILHLKNADIIDGYTLMATELSQKTLEECSRPMAPKSIFKIVIQVLKALEYAHSQKVIHCDVTPSNIFLFSKNRAALGDFGIGMHLKGRIVTVDDFGTPGYVAPEQAYGKPTYSSDCFAVAAILYEFLTASLPKWPFKWPLKGYDKLKQKTSIRFADFMKKALNPDPEKRYKDASKMLHALNIALPEKIKQSIYIDVHQPPAQDWKKIKIEQYKTKYKTVFKTFIQCKLCSRPISEQMSFCPWCGTNKNTFEEKTSLPLICPDCRKGVLPEWHYCPWCYGPGFSKPADTITPNYKYNSKCKHCGGKTTHFMKYCPWCHIKIKPKKLSRFSQLCDKCNWPVDKNFWHFCPWCRNNLHQT